MNDAFQSFMLEAQDRKLKTYKNILFETALGKLIIINKSVLMLLRK